MKHPTPEIEATSNRRLLTCLGIAIDEAKLSRIKIRPKGDNETVDINDRHSERLRFLDREILYLQQMMTEVRRQTDLAKSPVR